MLVSLDAREGREPNEDVLPLANRQRREAVWAGLAHEVALKRGTRIFEQGPECLLKEVEKFAIRATIEMANRCDHEALGCRGRAEGRAPASPKGKSRFRTSRPQEQNVVRIDHRRVGRGPMQFPDRAAVESREGLCAVGHAGKASEPHKAVRIIEVPELPDDLDPERFLTSTNSRSNRWIRTSRCPGCRVYWRSSTIMSRLGRTP